MERIHDKLLHTLSTLSQQSTALHAAGQSLGAKHSAFLSFRAALEQSERKVNRCVCGVVGCCAVLLCL